jgi:hypothetical protein
MASPYDALLEPPSSKYDALLATPSPYDALLTAQPQIPHDVLAQSNPEQYFNPVEHPIAERIGAAITGPLTPARQVPNQSQSPYDVLTQANPEQYFNPAEHPIAERAVSQALDTAKGLIPTSLEQGVYMMAAPIAGGIHSIQAGAGAIQDWIAGKPLDQIQRERFPESQMLVEADKTPAFSKERFKAGYDVVAQMLMAGGLVHGMKAKPAATANAADVPFAQSDSPAIRSAVGEQAPMVEGVPSSAPTIPLSTDPQSADLSAVSSRPPLSEAPPLPSRETPLVPASDNPVPQPDPNIPPVEGASPDATWAQTPVPDPVAADTAPPVTDGTAPLSPTGVRNFIVDQQRIDRGLPERMQPLRQTNVQAWDAAMAKIDQNPNAGRELVADVKDNPRALKPEETALLAHETVTRENNFDGAVDEVNNAKTPEELVAAKQRLAVARDDVHELYDVGQNMAGYESGASLQARKILVNKDYTLARMEAEKRAIANDGKPLSDNQLAQVKAVHSELTKVKAKLDSNESARSEEKQLVLYRQIVKESLQGAKDTAKRGGTLQTALNSAAVKARQRIMERRGRLSITVDPLNVAGLVDEAIIGASHIANGVTKFSDWSMQMVKDFGERIKPFLKDLYNRAKEYHDAHAKLFGQAGDADVLSKIRANAAAGNDLNPKHVYDLARAHVNAGIDGLDNVMRAVHNDIKQFHPGLTERNVRDAFSGYGNVKFPSREADLAKLREYRRLGQLTSAIEDAQRSEVPKKTGLQRDKPSQMIREKMKELTKAMRDNGIETMSPEEQLASANQARATNLRNQIEDLTKQLETGIKPEKGAPAPASKEVLDLMVKRDQLKAQLKAIDDASNPPKTPEQIALDRYKKAIQKRTADIQARINAGDYTKPTIRKTQLDAEASRMKAEHQTVVNKFETQLERDRLASRPRWQKVMEQVAGAARASALSGYHTLLKLASYDLSKLYEAPLTEIGGGSVMRLPGLRGISDRANLESGNTLRSLGEFYSNFAGKGMQEAWRVLRTGTTESKLLHGKPNYTPPRWYDFFGNLHMAEKAPLITGTEAMYRARAYSNAIKNGLDPNDEFVRGTINKAVFDYSQKAILQENNIFADAVNGLHARLEKINPKTGQANIANSVISTMVKTLLTKGIVRTPANYFAQTIARTPAGLVTGLVKAGMAHYRGIGNLHPIEANAISALIKTGAVGSAFFVMGAIDATKEEEDRTFGGYWEPGRKRGGDDVEWGKIRIGGVNGTTFSHIITHNPLTEVAQMGSTMMRVALSKSRRHDPEEQGMTVGAVKAVVGLVGKAPVASPVMRMGQDRTNVTGDILQGLVPQLLQNIAEDTDSAEHGRKPQTASQQIEVAIPGLRQDVPEKRR